MKLSKSLLGAILIGISLQSCSLILEDDFPKPSSEQEGENGEGVVVPENCPACGMG